MLKPILRGALPAIVAGVCSLPLAQADIYTWTDASGRVNVSNMAPPEGVRVTSVVHEGPPVRNDAARDALREAEVRLLAERVRQLQEEVEIAKRPPPPPVEYRAMQPAPVAPPLIQYITVAAPQYPAAPPQQVNTGCYSGWPDCQFGWYPGYSGFYPVSVIVPRDRHFVDHHRRHPSPNAPGRGLIAPWLPIPAPGGRGR